MKKVIALSVITATMLLANGYKIPEQSLNGMALSAANVANANGADTAYYNPANMVFNEDKNSFELLMTYIHLYSVKFESSTGDVYNSRKEDFLVPQFHFASRDFDGWRWGISVTTPAGLSKRWDDVTPEATAKEFTLKTVEINPSIAYKMNNNVGFAFGVRAVKSEGIANGMSAGLYSEYLNGTSWDYGWNAALSVQNDERDTKFAITYRSKIDLTLKGDASGYYNKVLLGDSGLVSFNTPGKVTLPIPAALNVALAKTFDKTTVEVVFERTFWSRYKELNFDFDDPTVELLFGTPKAKNWKDANTYRIGLTHQCTEKLTAMVGYAYDNTPIPDSTVEYSLPDSDKHIFSGGIKYKLDDRMSIGFSALYTKQKKRDVNNAYVGTGTFKDGGALLMAFGMDYSF
ncbi:membrane protein [Nautilia profundicola AmH]|uniref:Membrane protein n=1 Tax=Nautilia profundicola (strain ATCC BAA-1463 / DSM 18972 / AmH) TaxID=598659 RepID=B9L5L3_NAUPA|nr:outer membrane protein transport protein [Nautilia profundicola]ACM93655.1 membrane protein [Nautilia profundicola AmH]